MDLPPATVGDDDMIVVARGGAFARNEDVLAASSISATEGGVYGERGQRSQ